MKQLSMLGILLFLSFGAFAQRTVSGKVLDQESGEPVNYAVVYSQSKSTRVNNVGAFSITVPTGESITVKAVGYVYHRIPDDVKGEITIELKPSENVLNSVEVAALRATDDVPVARTDLQERDIEKQDVARDMPYILENTPSVVTTSDAGAGIGYTGIRIRGSDQSRINVTINGIPVNDAESQGVFWVNTPDLASSVSSLQVQRGVGTSTNGAGAFGASINMETKSLSKEAYADLHVGGGSFNTQRYTLNFGTGLMGGHWTLDGRASRIVSDGWIDRASSDLRSYYLALGYQTENTTVKAIVFGGRERTYQAWYGTDSATYANDNTFNYAGAIYDDNWNVVDYYDDQVDNYGQDYYQLHINHNLNSNWKLGVSGFYTRGAGYYQEYQQNQAFSEYGLAPIFNPNDTINSTDLTRRLWLDNHYYGAIANVSGSIGDLNLIVGGAWNQYDGDHYGTILWARFASDSEPKERFYYNNSLKTDWNAYAKADYSINNKLSAYADLQLRNVNYSGEGTERGNSQLSFADNFYFFNPKVGLVYSVTDHSRIYASYAIANREPNRNDFQAAIGGENPRPERLQDVEVGYEGGTERFSWSINGYFMYYTDQLALTGELDGVGYPIRENIGESYRAGIEISSSWRVFEQLTIHENVTLSRNRNVDYFRSIGDTATESLGSTPISYSPSIIANVTAEVHLPLGLNLEIIPRYVGEQHLENSGNENLILPAYFITDIRLSGTWQVEGMKQFRAYVMANNVFSEEYAANGYVYDNSVWFYPQAPINYMFGVEFSF